MNSMQSRTITEKTFILMSLYTLIINKQLSWSCRAYKEKYVISISYQIDGWRNTCLLQLFGGLAHLRLSAGAPSWL